MADYARANTGGATHFTDKDGLTTGDPNKLIVGSEHDSEFNAALTAINTKYDSGDIANQATSEAGTSGSTVMSPEGVQFWGDANGGIVGELRLLADPGADGLLGWDDSASADANIVQFTMGTGLAFSGTTIGLSFLGLEALTDPAADSIAFWDDTTNAFAWMTAEWGLEFDNTNSTVRLADAAATTTNPIDITSGAVTVDLTALTNIEGNALAATDEILVDDGGVTKSVAVQDMGFRVQTSQASQTLAADDMNSIMKFTGTATLTIDENVTIDIPIGVPVILICDHATQELTVQADTSVTLESIFHPGGAANASDNVVSGGMAILVQTETDVWQLTGDIST